MNGPISIFWDPRCEAHTVPRGFPERPARVQRTIPCLEERGWDLVEAASAVFAGGMAGQARRLAEAVHEPAYVQRMEQAVASVAADEAAGRFPRSPTPILDTADNPLSPGTAVSAWAAVEAALAGGDHVMRGAGHRAMSVTRPPGHHCERDRAMGFCYLNQVAILAQGLLDVHGAERVAVLDFDVHHGNGTQHLFDHRPDVMYLSVHQYPFYPGTGAAAERGIGDGLGTTVNAPLPAGSGDDVYRQVMDEVLLPALRGFAPDVLLVSAGFDAWRGDPVGGMALSEDAFHRFGLDLAAVAEEICDGRLVSVLEGGYDLSALPGLIDLYLLGTVGAERPAV